MAAGLESCILVSPKLTLEKNTAGKFEFGMLPGNPFYERLERMKSLIEVYEDETLLWQGRAVKIETNFYLQKKVFCEGILAYLNDSIQPPHEYHDITVAQFLEELIFYHNAQVEADRRFKLGLVTVRDSNDSIFRYTNYESTLEAIKKKLIEKFGGIFRARIENGERYIDYLEDYPGTCQQQIRFDTNLLDYSKTMTAADVATRCIPLGKKLDESPIEALDMRLTIESVNNKSEVLEIPEAVENFGKITKVVTWDDVTTPEALKSKGEAWLRTNQYEKLVLECKFADLHFMDKGMPPVRLLDRIQVVSAPHGMDAYFPVTKLCIDLMEPAKTEIALGDEGSASLTSSIISGNNAINGAIDEKPTFSQTRKLAQQMAKMLLDAGIGGYVYMTPDELYIMEKPTLKDSKRFWRWNMGGFAYTSDGGKTYKTAITMDGSILADFITAGTMFADRIRGGSLVIGGSDGADGVLQVKNANGTVIFKADKNGVTISGNAFTVNSTNFTLSTDGHMTAKNASVSGSLEVQNPTAGKPAIFKANSSGVAVEGDYLTINAKNLKLNKDGTLESKSAKLAEFEASKGSLKSIDIEEMSAKKLDIRDELSINAKLGTVSKSDGFSFKNGTWGEQFHDVGVHLEVNNKGLRIYSDDGNSINLYPMQGIKATRTILGERAIGTRDVNIEYGEIFRNGGSEWCRFHDGKEWVKKNQSVLYEPPDWAD